MACNAGSVAKASKLLTSGKAAKAIDVHPSTLWRWQQAGIVTPAWVTPGGQARWNLKELREQVGFKVAEPVA